MSPDAHTIILLRTGVRRRKGGTRTSKEKFAHAEREGKAAEMQLTFQATQRDQAIASLKQGIQNPQATSTPDERIREPEGKIGYVDALMRSMTQEIEGNDDRCLE